MRLVLRLWEIDRRWPWWFVVVAVVSTAVLVPLLAMVLLPPLLWALGPLTRVLMVGLNWWIRFWLTRVGV